MWASLNQQSAGSSALMCWVPGERTRNKFLKNEDSSGVGKWSNQVRGPVSQAGRLSVPKIVVFLKSKDLRLVFLNVWPAPKFGANFGAREESV